MYNEVTFMCLFFKDICIYFRFLADGYAEGTFFAGILAIIELERIVMWIRLLILECCYG